MSSATRELLADRYRLTERIATGGMGVVWRARDERLDRDIAIKLIRPEYADDPTFRQRLQLEARATAAICDPHVVRLHDVCEEPDPDGGCQAFIVMELVDGQPLSTVLRDGRLPIPLVISIITQTASALAAAHEQQIVHRDIKPANLMLNGDGRITVLDFGIARAADAVALTATGHLLGTARYIAPEQAAGRGATATSDVYALGVVAFECLAGAVPFDADSDVAIALAHLREPVPSLPSEVPPTLARLVERMLAKDPGDRPTASQVAAALATTSVTNDTDPIVVPVTPTDRASTKLLKTIPLPRGGRLAAPDYRDTRSAPLRPAIVLPAAGLAVLLLVTAAIAGGSDALPHSTAAGNASHGIAKHLNAVATTVEVDPVRYIGGDWAVVSRQLTALGLTPVAHFAGHGPTQTVVGLAPTGRVALGSEIVVEVSQHAPTPTPKAHPKPPKPHNDPGHLPPGQAKKHGGPGPG